MTNRERLHQLVDELTDAEAEAALTRLLRERQAVEQWADSRQEADVEDAWALANAHEAVREEPW